MKNVNKFVLLSFLVMINYALEDVDMKQQIEQLDQNRFGHTLLDTIYLQLQTQEPIERLMGTLQQIEDRYYQDQKEEDVSHKDYQDSCTVDLQNLDQNIKVSDNERIKLEARLEGELYPKRQILQKLITQKQGELKEFTGELNELDQQREEEGEEYQHKIHEHEDVIAILMQARTLFTENLQTHDNSFIQLNNNGIELLQKHFGASIKRASKFTYRTSWGKMFKALATITSRVHQLQDSAQVENVILLIDQLLEQVHDSMDLEKFSEEKRIQAYEKTRNLLVISINTTESTLASATTDLALVSEIIEQTQATLDNVNQRLQMLQLSRDDRFTICEQEAQDYQDSRSQRDSDRDVVSQTIGLLNKSLRTLKEQLALRMSAGEEFEYF
ncbi:unnamed protein product (macronuclear) [Paramecium tetraurelia]|uniref:Trichocyst matrix protein n=1 Tax=Paramecium tetraurelia TaxID=5888 RepID=A0E213_PARTE|nr:uncharacterized protein GSPATT00022501001 [Paramecium tetraurelia]CAK89330.1 unnamed protein product [Paramecium tetraurelia]|eukprot:XP_001456727.1 hypothetical protein (macronuclear) [Paramecium tetraurelia strain d4-2]